MCAVSAPPDLFSFLSVLTQTRRSCWKEALISLTGLYLLLFTVFSAARVLWYREQEGFNKTQLFIVAFSLMLDLIHLNGKGEFFVLWVSPKKDKIRRRI